jgi:hypothetical protein
MFTDKVELKDFEKQDPEYQDLLRRVLAIQADCEIGGPNLYVKDILPNAPTKLDQLIVARTAAAWLVILASMSPTRSAGPIKNDTLKPFVARSKPGKILPCLDSSSTA